MRNKVSVVVVVVFNYIDLFLCHRLYFKEFITLKTKIFFFFAKINLDLPALIVHKSGFASKIRIILPKLG